MWNDTPKQETLEKAYFYVKGILEVAESIPLERFFLSKMTEIVDGLREGVVLHQSIYDMLEHAARFGQDRITRAVVYRFVNGIQLLLARNYHHPLANHSRNLWEKASSLKASLAGDIYASHWFWDASGRLLGCGNDWNTIQFGKGILVADKDGNVILTNGATPGKFTFTFMGQEIVQMPMGNVMWYKKIPDVPKGEKQ